MELLNILEEKKRFYLDKYIPFQIHLTPIHPKKIIERLITSENFNVRKDSFDFLFERVIYQPEIRELLKLSNDGLLLLNYPIRSIRNFLIDINNLSNNKLFIKNEKTVIIFFFIKHFLYDFYNELDDDTSIEDVQVFKLNAKKISINKQIQAFKGIDFIAPSDHEIITECASFRLGKSNSYAAPYVTAMVGNLIYEKGFMTVDEIRNNLCVESNSFIYSPDWIESAWIAPNYRKSKAEYYFNADKRDLPECIDDIDTVVFLNAEDIEKYADIGKHIVYIGNDRVSRFDKKHHFWSRELRHEQIISSKERTGEIDIPSVCCIFDNQVDIIWCLCVLKELFENEGYNAFVGCDLVDSVLYDLEYLPDGDTIQEKLADFVYWQTYYQQSDIILAGTTDKDNDVIIVDKPDMVVYFNLEKNGITVKMFSDGEAGEEKYYTNLDIGSITKIYGDIIGSFEKEDE